MPGGSKKPHTCLDISIITGSKHEKKPPVGGHFHRDNDEEPMDGIRCSPNFLYTSMGFVYHYYSSRTNG
jgi:hypothetical protein